MTAASFSAYAKRFVTFSSIDIWSKRNFSLKKTTNLISSNISEITSNQTPTNTMPLKILNVAEKNDAAKSIVTVMTRGQFQRREGFSPYNKIYYFDHQFRGQPCHFMMTSVSGHLLNYEFTGQYKNWHSCSYATLFDAPVEKTCLPDFEPILRTLQREARTSNVLIIWTDCDREGENIGFEIINTCLKVKPGLTIYRAKFSEITAQSIARAWANLIQPDKRVSDAVDVRAELDLRIGAAFTRLQTVRLQQAFPTQLTNKVVSYGSCQFPTLGFIVERYNQVMKFEPEPFWKIKVTHDVPDQGLSAVFNWGRDRLFDQLACLVLHQKCLEKHQATVTDVRSKPKSKWRPLPLDTVELEKLASRKLRISAKQTITIAEKLYVKGLISYPRTETNMFPKEMDLSALVQMQTPDQRWGGFAQNLLGQGCNPRAGSKTDNAHPPIHPTKYAADLQGDEQKIYELVTRHFLACCSKDALGQETRVEVDLAEEKFSVAGLVILERNYLDVYPYDNWNAKTIPHYVVRQVFTPTKIEMVDGETTAPALLTEADLISLMEKHGIGTDATHAEHIEKIKERSYVGMTDDRRFVPGQLGMGLVEGYDSIGDFEISKPYLRSELEASLKSICEGRSRPEDVLAAQVAKYKEVFEAVSRNAQKLDLAIGKYYGQQAQTVLNQGNQQGDIVRKCPDCNSDMAMKQTRTDKLCVSCLNYPECRLAYWMPDCVAKAEVIDQLCPRCAPNRVKLINFTFKPRMMPIYPLEYVACIGGCDTAFMEAIGIRLPNRQRAASHPQPTPRNNPPPPGGRGPQPPPGPPRGPPRGPGGGGGGGPPGAGGGVAISGRAPAANQKKGVRPVQPVQPIRSMSADRGSTGSGLMPLKNTIRSYFSGSTPDASNSVCLCGTDASLFTVKKDGPNKGRQFYCCSKGQSEPGRCNFFLWADVGQPPIQAPNAQRTPQPSYSSGYNQRSFGNNITQPVVNAPVLNNRAGNQDGDIVICDCGSTAAKRHCKKNGPNMDRPFHVCAHERGFQCNFFQWAS